MLEPIFAQSLDDLGAVPVTITIPRPDGKSVDVRLRALSEQEIWDIRKSIVWPKAPIINVSKDGRETYDFNNESYLAAFDEASRLQAHKMLLKTLSFPIPGETEAEQIEALQKRMGQYAFTILIRAVNEINIVKEETLALVANSFRSADASPFSGNGKIQTHGGRMENLIEG